MKLKIKDIAVEGLLLEGALSVKAYDLPVEEFRDWDQIHYRFSFDLAQKECLVHGVLQTQMTAPCARCLEPIPLKIETPFEHMYHFATHGDIINLTTDIRDDILLALPIAPKCELDVQGRCPYTGVSHTPGPSLFDKEQREATWGDLDHLS